MSIKMVLCRNYIVEMGGEGEKEGFVDGHVLRNIGVTSRLHSRPNPSSSRRGFSAHRVRRGRPGRLPPHAVVVESRPWSKMLEVTRNEVSPDRIRMVALAAP